MKYIISIFLILTTIIALYAEGKPRVMVLNATSKRNFYQTYKIGDGEEFLTLELRKAILQTGVFDVVNNDKILEDALKAQYEGAYDMDTVAKYGKKLGANYAVVPKVMLNNVTPINKNNSKSGVNLKFMCNAELYNLSTGELLYSCSAEGETKDTGVSLATKDPTSYGNPKIHGVFVGDSKGAKGLVERIGYELAEKLALCVGGQKILKLTLKGDLKADTFLETDKFYINNIKQGARGKLVYYDKDKYPVLCGECIVDTVRNDKVRMYVSKLMGNPPKGADVYAEIYMQGLINPEDEGNLFPVKPLKNKKTAVLLPICEETAKTIVNDILCDKFIERNFDITDETTRNRLMENMLEQAKLKDDPEGYLRALENKMDVDLAVIPNIAWKTKEKEGIKATCTLGLRIVDMRTLETIFSKTESQTAPGVTEKDAVNNAFILLVDDMFDDNDIVGLVDRLDNTEKFYSLVVNNVGSVTLSNLLQKSISERALSGKIEKVGFEDRTVTFKVYGVKDLDKFTEYLETVRVEGKSLEIKKTDNKQIILELTD